MTLGEFYDKVESWSEDTMDFCITDVFSWRGVYAEPACSLTCTSTQKQDNLDMLRRLTNEVFYGWKGGEFTYTFDDTIHFECEQSAYTPNNGYLIGFIARNQNEEVKHIFG